MLPYLVFFIVYNGTLARPHFFSLPRRMRETRYSTPFLSSHPSETFFSCQTDHYLIYVSTKEPVQVRRGPWTVVYKTNLTTGKTERLTPQGIYIYTLCTNQLKIS
jgi:hypothetical protein